MPESRVPSPESRKYFGTDGIRGRVGEWPITAEFMLKLGRAAGAVLGGADGRASVLIGKDTRVSGYMFESALEAGLVAAGADVRLLGPMPTPAVAYLTRSLRASAGIVISASHNPHQDNGVKFFSAQGEKLDDAVEVAIEREVDAPFLTVPPERLGKALRVADASARYAEYCKATLPAGFSLRGMKLVVDCAHGATYQVAPHVFAELGAEVVTIGCAPDGFNINRDVGSTRPGALMRAVREQGADLGIAFDGDGDRVQMVDHAGALADGDDLLYVLACDWRARGLLRGPVVGTLMSNYGLERALARMDVPFLRARVGDRYVLQQLREHGGVLGGETSGHILCLDRASTGDGLVCALAVLDALMRAGCTLAQAREGLHKLPQTTVNVAAAGGAALVAAATVQQALGAAQRALEGRGRVVLRPSGTEPVVRVTVEAADADEVRQLVAQLADAVRSAARTQAQTA
ncbi:MAG: phosphoglucosamine mutase [Mizugakiibacter sp.]|uniref:phosphoglucosamine mutase n=1 Tax=Mizugakiibacter sp. TaxID=1972610 RepID=UPI0031C94F08|nr:phosphoglucosamine mutase [Xanthomonadaceae bacterium]